MADDWEEEEELITAEDDDQQSDRYLYTATTVRLIVLTVGRLFALYANAELSEIAHELSCAPGMTNSIV